MLEHRLHILIDDERYRRLTEHARRRGVSVGHLVRDAIDQALPHDATRRRDAVKEILAADSMPVPDPEELRRELDDVRGRGA